MSEKEMGLVPVEFDLKIEDSYLARAFDFLAGECSALPIKLFN